MQPGLQRVDAEQLVKFQQLFPEGNHRDTQPLNGRVVNFHPTKLTIEQQLARHDVVENAPVAAVAVNPLFTVASPVTIDSVNPLFSLTLTKCFVLLVAGAIVVGGGMLAKSAGVALGKMDYEEVPAMSKSLKTFV